jgi:hypothetical protein
MKFELFGIYSLGFWAIDARKVSVQDGCLAAGLLAAGHQPTHETGAPEVNVNLHACGRNCGSALSAIGMHMHCELVQQHLVVSCLGAAVKY